MSITRQNLIAEVMKLTQLGVTGTADANTTTTAMVDSDRASYAEDYPEGSVLYIVNDSSGAMLDGAIFWTTNFNRDTGSFVVFPDRGTAITTDDTYELWRPCVARRTLVEEAVDRALTRRCFYWKLVPVSWLTNGDMQTPVSAGVLTGWSVSGTPVFTSSTGYAYPYLGLSRYYTVYTTSAGGGGSDYMYQEISVTESRTWNLAVLMRVAAATTATVSVYDVANSAAITTSGDTLSVTGEQSSGSDWTLVKASFSVPTDCDRVSIRITNGTHSGVIHVGFVSLWPSDARAIPIPTRVTSENMIGHVYEFKPQLGVDFHDSWQLSDRMVAVERASHAGIRVRLSSVLGSTLLAYQEMSHYAALTSDSDTTDCDDYIAAYAVGDELLAAIYQRVLEHDGLEAAMRYEAKRDYLEKRGRKALADRIPASPGPVMRRQ